MWRDICLTNQDAILAALGVFSEQLSGISRAVEAGDGAWLEQYFEQCRSQRNEAVRRRSRRSDRR